MATQNRLQWVLQPVNQPASEPVSQPACQPASRACKWVRRPNVYTYICVRSYFGSSVAVVSDCHRLGQSIMGSEAVNIAVNLQLSLTARDIQQALPTGEVPNTPILVAVKATATITPSPQIRPSRVPPVATQPHASDYVLALRGDLRLSLTAQDIEQAMLTGERNAPFPVVVKATATLIPSSAFLRPRIRPPPVGPLRPRLLVLDFHQRVRCCHGGPALHHG
jgi:hypothetical protein